MCLKVKGGKKKKKEKHKNVVTTSLTFFEFLKVFSAHQVYIYLIKNTLIL